MYCLIIQKANGKLIRETMKDRPDIADIEYWEDYYTDNDCWASGAVVINVYEVEDK